MDSILQKIQHYATTLPLSAQAELLNYAVYLGQKSQKKIPLGIRRDRLAAALNRAVALNPFAEITDPVSWQCHQRQDRPLPGRNDAN